MRATGAVGVEQVETFYGERDEATDVEVKGGLRTGTTVARSLEYAVERAVLTIRRERRS